MELTLKQAFAYFWQQIISKFVTADDIISDEMIDNICGKTLVSIEEAEW